MNEPITICSVILAGGKGTRMQGEDKGLLDYQGKPLIEHALEKVCEESQQLVISCNRNIAAYRKIAAEARTSKSSKLDIDVVIDAAGDYLGPLAGLLAASKVCQQNWLFTMPCDMPNVPADIIQRLAVRTTETECDIAVCHDGSRRQNLVMLLRRNITDSLSDYLRSGGRRVDQWQNQFRVLEVDFSDQSEMFGNLNRVEDF